MQVMMDDAFKCHGGQNWYKLYSISHMVVIELWSLYPTCDRQGPSFSDDLVCQWTYQRGGEYWRLKLTESSIKTISRDDSLTHFLVNALE